MAGLQVFSVEWPECPFPIGTHKPFANITKALAVTTLSGSIQRKKKRRAKRVNRTWQGVYDFPSRTLRYGVRQIQLHEAVGTVATTLEDVYVVRFSV